MLYTSCTCNKLIVDKVYRMGLMAELTGKMKTTTQAYTSPDISVPFAAAKPVQYNIKII